ncbi:MULTISPECIES: hypothetical protein [unclassified Nitrosospira]|jgi:hypothetical protein|uniref:hypothetical protein n=1 Tax=unclassified Nitrosospira TaxID=2609267 RepID=UPI000D313587|nr:MULTISPECIES: hypothetical protein [unclassified Nitrosospira]WON72698.1 hypothetical protein R5L00_09300 [Nitrosospira sp. Is2]
MILRKGVKALFFLLLLALSLVPVLQAAHALTHFAPANTIGISEPDGGKEVSGSVAEADANAGFDSDRFCLDCLALAGLGILLPVLAFCFFAQPARQPLPHLTALFIVPHFSSPYLTRAPPLA